MISHTPLPTPQNIRTLLLDPSTDFNAPINGTFDTLDPNKPNEAGDIPHPYEALSYTWGSAADCADVHISERPVRVRRNLFQALLRLHLRDRTRRLRIDALCINQQDAEERASQVAQMARVFGRASKVLIWVGEESAERDGELTFGFVRKAGELTREDAAGTGEAREVVVRKLDELSYDVFGRSPEREGNGSIRSDSGPPALIAFLSRAWFGRRWIIQELHSGKLARLICGEDEVSWRVFRRFISLFYNVRTGTDVEQVALTGPKLALSTALQLVVLEQGPSGTRDLLDLLETFSQFRCSDDRDLVYSLLSLARPVPGRRRVVADYSVSASELYRRLAVCYIQARQVLAVLRCAARRVSHSDGTADRDTTSYLPGSRTGGYPIAITHRNDWQRGRDDGVAHAQVMEDGLRLRIKAVHLGNIAAVYAVSGSGPPGLQGQWSGFELAGRSNVKGWVRADTVSVRSNAYEAEEEARNAVESSLVQVADSVFSLGSEGSWPPATFLLRSFVTEGDVPSYRLVVACTLQSHPWVRLGPGKYVMRDEQPPVSELLHIV